MKSKSLKLLALLQKICCILIIISNSQNFATLPQPGENIRNVCAGIGTDVDTLLTFTQGCNFTTLESKVDACCMGTFTALNDLIDFSDTFTAINGVQNTLSSKIDVCCTQLQNNFMGTFTTLAALDPCDPNPLFQTDVIAGSIVLSTTGNSYCLAQNITGSVIITASDVTLDLNMHTLIGTIDIASTTTNVTIKNGNVKPVSDGTDDSHAAILINAGAQKVNIHDCYIICSDNTVISGGNARSAIINGGDETIINNCFIQTGIGNTGTIGGNGGNGIESSGNNMSVSQTIILTGTGGVGTAGTGGTSGTGINSSGLSPHISLCTIIISLGGSGDSGGNGGNGITNTSPNCMISDCSIFTGTGGTATTNNGGIGGDGINSDNSSFGLQVMRCVIITGAGGSGGTSAGAGLAGGTGINIVDIDSSNAIIDECTITTGNGGVGGTGGTGGNGGIGISTLGADTQITNCVITTANGGAGSAAAGGMGGIAIQLLGDAAKVRDCSIKQTGNGGTGTPVGNGGDGILIESSATNTDISTCIIVNTGTDGSGIATATGGIAINDLSVGATEAIYSNFAFLINNSANAYVLAPGAAIDSPNGTAFAAGIDRLANIHKP